MNDPWKEVRELLCVRLGGTHDVLRATPAMRALKEAAPGRRITLLTSPAGAQAAQSLREVDDVITFEAPWTQAPGDAPTNDGAMIVQLAARGFDAAVIFTAPDENPLPAAYLAYLAGIPLRLAHCRENPHRLLSDWVPDPQPEKILRGEIRRQLDLVACIGCSTEDERASLSALDAVATQ